jgi:hypothetical protein
MSRRASLALLVVSLFLSGCGHYTLVSSERQVIGEAYSVDSPILWSRTKQWDMEVWTVDGPSLDALRFINGIEDGDTLFPVRNKDEYPRFRARMTPNEVMEFFLASVKIFSRSIDTEAIVRGVVPPGLIRAALIDAATVRPSGLRPARFGSAPGFRFDFSYLSTDGLERQGMVAGTIRGEKLHLIVYTGTSDHYFPKYQPAVEQILSSIQLLP